jgi:hypothetical protein
MKLRLARTVDPAFVMVVVDAGTQARNLRDMCRTFVETGKEPGYCGQTERTRLTSPKTQGEGLKNSVQVRAVNYEKYSSLASDACA